MVKYIKIFLLLILSASVLQAAYPEDKPIKIIVHTKPGGAVDLMARQVAQIAGKYTDQSIVVINKPGGSGLLALANVYNAKADGYTVLAFPAAFLAPIQTTDIGFGLEDFHYIACMTVSPEAILTNKHSKIATFKEILDDAKAHPGEQKWCGPGSGTLDHLMAVKIWHKAGITAKWIPYGGGGPAIASVMGNHAQVYVGNPEDILGRENSLQIAAIASEKRHLEFPVTPTFKELGVDLTNEVMWRGFAVKKGTDPEAIDYLENLFRKCHEDTAWQQFLKRTMVQGVFLENGEFTKLVMRDAESSQEYLKLAGFKLGTVPKSAPFPVLFFLIVLIILITVFYYTTRRRQQKLTDSVYIVLTGTALALMFFYQSLYFPVPRANTFVGAATVPRVWVLLLLLIAAILMVSFFKGKIEVQKVKGNIPRVWKIIAIITIYSVLMPIIGFFPATFFMLLAGMFFLKYKNYLISITISALVIAFMFFVFYQILMVPLPMGLFF